MRDRDTGQTQTALEDWLTRVGTVAGAVAGLAGFVYLVGGVVMWLRFRTADLPADQGVALMSKEQLFVVGLRLMILPLLVTGALVGVLALRASDRTRSLVHRTALAALAMLLLLLVVWSFGVIGWPPLLALILEVLVLAGAACAVVMLRRGVRASSALTFAAIAALIVVVVLGVPDIRIEDTAAGVCVAVVALLLTSMPFLVRLAPRRRLRPPPRATPVVLVALSVVAALIFSSGVWPRLAIVLATVAVLGVLAMVGSRWSDRLSRLGPERRWWLPLIVIAAVALVVPWSYASASWPIAVGLLLGVWHWRIHRIEQDDPASRRRFARAITITAVMAAAIVSIGRQLDEPVQLLHATVTPRTEGAQTIDGVYVNAGGDQVYVGKPGAGTIVAVPRSEVRDVAVGPPDERAPSPSLLSHIIPGDLRFSARPLEIWCNGQKYHWDQSRSVCRSHPTLFWKETESQHIRDFQRLGLPVRVWCPAEARRPCGGWILLRSRDNYLFGTAGVPRPLIPPPVPFSVDTSRLTEVCVSITDGEFALLREEAGETPVGFEAIVARDPEGKTVYDSGDYWVKVGPTRVETRPVDTSDCEPRLRIRAKANGNLVTATVIAWPRAKGVTPRQVAGAVRLSAWGPGGAMRPLGKRALKPAKTTSRASFRGMLPAGSWELRARYVAAAGIAYPQVLDTATVEATGARTGSSGGTRAPAAADR